MKTSIISSNSSRSGSGASSGGGSKSGGGNGNGMGIGVDGSGSGSGSGNGSDGASTSTSAGVTAPRLTLAATAAVTLCGCLALYQATLGFQVVSTEDGRRLEIARQPRQLPSAALDWPSRPLLETTLRNDGRITIISFIYTSCNAICSVVGTEFQQMQATIHARGLQDQVRLLSISFDPSDNPQQLNAYALRQHADRQIWQFAGIADASQRKAVLDTFGVVVVPAPPGEYIHNAAFHLVDKQGRLARIDDYDDPDQALADAVALYKTDRP